MRDASAPLIALLNGNNTFAMCDLLAITLAGGSVLRYSGADRAVTYAGNVYTTAVGFKRERTRMTRTLEVDSLSVTLLLDGTQTLSGVPFGRAAADGALDNARVSLYRAFFDAGGALVDALPLFEGEVAGVDPGSLQVKVEVESELGRLNVKVPANLVSPGCNLTIYSSACGVNKGTYQVSRTCAAGGSTTAVVATAGAEGNGYFNLGVITFTSGANAGVRRSVRDWNTTTKVFTLSIPLPTAPAAGDTFTVYPGCDKTSVMCNTRFANLTRFRGFPYVPRPEDAR